MHVTNSDMVRYPVVVKANVENPLIANPTFVPKKTYASWAKTGTVAVVSWRTANGSNDFVGEFTLTVTAVPEPSSLMLMGTSLLAIAALVFIQARRRHQALNVKF